MILNVMRLFALLNERKPCTDLFFSNACLIACEVHILPQADQRPVGNKAMCTVWGADSVGCAG